MDISAGGTATVSGNEAGQAVTLQNGFSFYGTTYNQLVMSTNGYLSTDPADNGMDNSNDCPIPAVGPTGGRMYPIHDDLVVSQGYTQYFATCPRTNELAIDGAPEDCTVFQWDDTNHFGSTATAFFNAEAILYHASGVILFQIDNDPQTGGTSTTGIQDPAGTDGLQYSTCNTPGTLAAQAAIAYYTCGTITVAPGTLPNATLNQAYSQQLTATGGTLPYAYALSAGALPAGLTLSGTGLISGTPTASGTFNFSVTVTDAKGCAATIAYTLVVDDNLCGGVTISVTPAVVPSGVVNTPYSVTLTATGGTGPYTWSIAAGALPAGLTLGGASGVISGTPTTAGASTFTVSVVDANQCSASFIYCIAVIEQANIFAGHGLGFGTNNTNAVQIFDATGAPAPVAAWQAYGSSAWGTNVAAGNTEPTSVEVDELLTGPGPGDIYGPHVRGWFANGTPIQRVNLFAYGTLKFGVNVAAGNVEIANENCTLLAEIISGAGPGAVFGPHVRAFNHDGAAVTVIQKINFFAYSTLKWGVNVEAGDTDSDGFEEILTGAGPGQIFATTVRGWDYDGNQISPIARINFNAFQPLAWGVNVSGGDVDNDGAAEIVAARGPDPAVNNDFSGFNTDGGPITNIFTANAVHTSQYGGRIDWVTLTVTDSGTCLQPRVVTPTLRPT